MRVTMLRGSQISITVPLTSALFLGANPRRIALTIGTPLNNNVTISVNNPAVFTTGLTLNKGTNPFTLTREAVGDWIQNNLYCIASPGQEVLTVIEVLEP